MIFFRMDGINHKAFIVENDENNSLTNTVNNNSDTTMAKYAASKTLNALHKFFKGISFALICFR